MDGFKVVKKTFTQRSNFQCYFLVVKRIVDMDVKWGEEEGGKGRRRGGRRGEGVQDILESGKKIGRGAFDNGTNGGTVAPGVVYLH